MSEKLTHLLEFYSKFSKFIPNILEHYGTQFTLYWAVIIINTTDKILT